MRVLASGGAASCSLGAQAVVVFAVHGNRLVTHGSVQERVIVEHAVVVGGGIGDDAHEEGDQGGVVHQGKQEGRVDREDEDGAHGGHHGGGGRLHAFLAEFHSAGVADAADPQRIVGNPGKIGGGKERTETWGGGGQTERALVWTSTSRGRNSEVAVCLLTHAGQRFLELLAVLELHLGEVDGHDVLLR